jgi:hypothetical protein
MCPEPQTDLEKKQGSKTYHPPSLVEWGEIKDLTQGQGAPGDDGFTGTTT